MLDIEFSFCELMVSLRVVGSTEQFSQVPLIGELRRLDKKGSSAGGHEEKYPIGLFG